MKLFFVITLSLGLALAAPSDVEIVKQRLIKFPEDPQVTQTREQADETRRILDEINKINVALGYMKKEEQISQQPVLLDSEKYLFPKPPSPPVEWKFHNGGGFPFRQIPGPYQGSRQQQYHTFQPYSFSHAPFQPSSSSYSQLQQQQTPIARKIIHQHSVMIPQPFNTQTYYYPEPYLRAPFRDNSRVFKPNDSNAEELGSNLMAVSNDITSIVEYARNLETHDVDITAANNEEFEAKLLQSVHKIVGDVKEKNPKIDNATKKDHGSEKRLTGHVKYVAIPAKSQTYPSIIVARRPPSTVATIASQKPQTHYKPVYVQSKPAAQTNSAAQEQVQSQRLLHKQRLKQNNKQAVQNQHAVQNQQASQQQALQQQQQHHYAENQHLLQNTEKTVDLKSPLSALIRPFPQIFRRRPTTPAPLQEPAQVLDENDPDYDNDDEYQNFSSGDKGIFQPSLANQKDILKGGGILIQKLRVRKGGIAIAGPGGVATAGSGGTAIIGPGGIALTHPRSLTIAGPGAKIVALPETYDLEKAVWETSARSFPSEGVVVATGPTIYYSP